MAGQARRPNRGAQLSTRYFSPSIDCRVAAFARGSPKLSLLSLHGLPVEKGLLLHVCRTPSLEERSVVERDRVAMVRKAKDRSSRPTKTRWTARPPEPEPTTASLIRPARHYADWMDCLIHLHCEIARLGLKTSDLARYQSEVFQELEARPDESAISELFMWWRYDMEGLVRRARGHGPPAKPRINLTMFFTQKRNFAVEWRPTGTLFDAPGHDCDWKQWHRAGGSFGTRPSNELVFIRALEHVSRAFENSHQSDAELRRRIDNWPEYLKSADSFERLKQDRRQYIKLRRTTDAILLQAAAALVAELKGRLEHSFEVTMINDIFAEWDEIKDETAPLGKSNRLTKWTIENVAERTRRLETEELKDFPNKYGCPVDTFIQVLNDVDKRKGSGPPPSPHTKDERVTQALKKAGHSKITLSVARRYRQLLERHRPELFTSASPPSPKVVPFKRPDE